MQHVNGVPVYSDDPTLYYSGLEHEPTWFSAQGGVYRCTSRHAPYTEVAIKKYLVEETDLYPDLFVMPKELVENEIYTMTKCVHDNILKLQGVYLHQEFVYLIMPYCTGGSLQQYVFDHHLTIGQLVHIITSVGDKTLCVMHINMGSSYTMCRSLLDWLKSIAMATSIETSNVITFSSCKKPTRFLLVRNSAFYYYH